MPFFTWANISWMFTTEGRTPCWLLGWDCKLVGHTLGQLPDIVGGSGGFIRKYLNQLSRFKSWRVSYKMWVFDFTGKKANFVSRWLEWPEEPHSAWGANISSGRERTCHSDIPVLAPPRPSVMVFVPFGISACHSHSIDRNMNQTLKSCPCFSLSTKPQLLGWWLKSQNGHVSLQAYL